MGLKKMAVLVYGITSYLFGMVVLTYAILFVGGWFVPRTIDSGLMGEGIEGFAINLSVMALFAIQHTIMARDWFKEWITRYIPRAAERATFVAATAFILLLLFNVWRAYPTSVWDVSGTTLGYALTTLSIFGFGLGIYSSFLIDHFELFGLKQVIKNMSDDQFQKPKFVMPWLYRVIRHPLMFGFLIGFWSTPYMSVGHLFFSSVITIYVFVGIRFEEASLEKELGQAYVQYKAKTPMLLPFQNWSR